MDNRSNLPPRCLQGISSFSKSPEMPEMTEELPEKSVKRIEEPAISLKKIAQLEADLQEMKKDKDIEMSRWAAKIAQIEANLKIAKLEADLVDERERNRELKRKIAETKRKDEDLEAQLSEQNMEVREGKAKIEELEGKINALQSKISGFETQIRTQDTEVRDGKAKIGELEGKINALQSKNSDLETQLDRTLTFGPRDGWSYLAKTASWYKVIGQEMTFDEAEAYCSSRKGHLVSIHSQEEHDFLWKLARTVDSKAGFWIGMKKNPNKGNALEWTDGSSVDFINWHPGHPSSSHALLGTGTGKWGAYLPTYQFRFICKRSSQF